MLKQSGFHNLLVCVYYDLFDSKSSLIQRINLSNYKQKYVTKLIGNRKKKQNKKKNNKKQNNKKKNKNNYCYL